MRKIILQGHILSTAGDAPNLGFLHTGFCISCIHACYLFCNLDHAAAACSIFLAWVYDDDDALLCSDDMGSGISTIQLLTLNLVIHGPAGLCIKSFSASCTKQRHGASALVVGNDFGWSYDDHISYAECSTASLS